MSESGTNPPPPTPSTLSLMGYIVKQINHFQTLDLEGRMLSLEEKNVEQEVNYRTLENQNNELKVNYKALENKNVELEVNCKALKSQLDKLTTNPTTTTAAAPAPTDDVTADRILSLEKKNIDLEVKYRTLKSQLDKLKFNPPTTTAAAQAPTYDVTTGDNDEYAPSERDISSILTEVESTTNDVTDNDESTANDVTEYPPTEREISSMTEVESTTNEVTGNYENLLQPPKPDIISAEDEIEKTTNDVEHVELVVATTSRNRPHQQHQNDVEEKETSMSTGQLDRVQVNSENPERKKRKRMKMSDDAIELSERDDLATSLVVDPALGFDTHKMNIKKKLPRKFNQPKLQDILTRFCASLNYQETFNEYINTGYMTNFLTAFSLPEQKHSLRNHIYSFLKLYDLGCGFKIQACIRYSGDKDNAGAKIVSTQRWQKGQKIEDLVGFICDMGSEQASELIRPGENDFSNDKSQKES